MLKIHLQYLSLYTSKIIYGNKHYNRIDLHKQMEFLLSITKNINSRYSPVEYDHCYKPTAFMLLLGEFIII